MAWKYLYIMPLTSSFPTLQVQNELERIVYSIIEAVFKPGVKGMKVSPCMLFLFLVNYCIL